MLTIGIDLGTSAVKLLLMDGSGRVLNTVSRPYPISFPRPGWSEQDPADWLRETVAGVRELTADVDRSQVAGIGCGGQMHGLVALDRDDRVLRPAILWNDGRTGAEVRCLNEQVGRQTLSRCTGNIAFAGFTAPKLLWMRAHEPHLFGRIAKIMLPKDYVNYMLTGVHCTDVSDASGTLLFDVQRRRWSREMMDICAVREDQLPRVYESFEPVGTLRPEMAEQLGLPATVTVCAGAGDNAAAAVGTGTVGEGACNISLGTSGTVFISSRRFGVDRNNALHAFAHADGSYHLMGCMLSAASCNKWWMDDILGTADYGSQQGAVTDDKLGRDRVFFLPYLMGERSPINDTEARGCFVGLSMDTARADMTQAVLEGVAFGIRDCLEVARRLGIQVKTSRICGGGAKSPLWRKIVANVCGLTLETVACEEGPGYGGAILAAVACGAYASVEEAAAKLVTAADRVEPDPDIAARYETQYRKFQKLYPALKDVFPVLNR